MTSRPIIAFAALLPIATVAGFAGSQTSAGEYSKHLDALNKLSLAVAQAMPPEQYSVRPHPESMTFGELMAHIAATNYQFCAGLKDTDAPGLATPTGKDSIVKFLSDSFE
jgi:DinB superfamily